MLVYRLAALPSTASCEHHCNQTPDFYSVPPSAANKVYKIQNLTDEEATLVEPAACAIHGVDQLNAPVGIDALIIGAGPTGLIMAQLLKQNGAARVVIAANKGIKTEVAKQLEAGDEYIELDRRNPDPQWEKLKTDNPYGFDVVVRPSPLLY